MDRLLATNAGQYGLRIDWQLATGNWQLTTDYSYSSQRTEWPLAHEGA